MRSEIILEKIEGILCGRLYVDGRKTSAYIVPQPDNRNLFTTKQLSEIDNEPF